MEIIREIYISVLSPDSPTPHPCFRSRPSLRITLQTYQHPQSLGDFTLDLFTACGHRAHAILLSFGPLLLPSFQHLALATPIEIPAPKFPDPATVSFHCLWSDSHCHYTVSSSRQDFLCMIPSTWSYT